MRVPIVQAIEQDDFSRCGGDVYARGHIRTLARAVGLDPEPLVAQYDAEHGGRPAPTPAAPLFEAERIRPEPRRPNWTAAMVAAIVAVIGFVGFTLFSGGDDGGTGTQVAEGSDARQPTKPPSPRQADQARRPASPSPPTAPSRRRPRDKVTVKLTAADGQQLDLRQGPQRPAALRRRCCKQGESKTFQDDERIDLVLGNAGGDRSCTSTARRSRTSSSRGQVERLSVHQGRPRGGLTRVRRHGTSRRGGEPLGQPPAAWAVGGTK